MSRLNNLYLFLNDEKGRTLPRAKLFFYENNSFDFKNTYADKALTSVNPNPVIADGAGRFPNIFLEADTYRVVLQDEDGVEISTKDDVDNLLSDGDLLGTSWISSLSTVSQMVAESRLSIGDRVRTSGYTTSGDGGGNDYEIVAGGTGTADGGSFIDLDNGLQAKGLFPSGVNLNQFGAAGDSVTDDTTSITNAIAFLSTSPLSCLLLLSTYLCTGFSVPSGICIKGSAPGNGFTGSGVINARTPGGGDQAFIDITLYDDLELQMGGLSSGDFASNIIVENVEINTSAAFGAQVFFTTDMEVDNFRINLAGNVQGHGFKIGNIAKSSIKNVNVQGDVSIGVSCSGTASLLVSSMEDCVLENIRVRKNDAYTNTTGDHGVYLLGMKNCVMDGIFVEGNWTVTSTYSVKFRDSHDCRWSNIFCKTFRVTADNNTIFNVNTLRNKIENLNCEELYLFKDAAASVSDLTFKNVRADNIFESNAIDGPVIFKGDFYSGTTGDIRLDGCSFSDAIVDFPSMDTSANRFRFGLTARKTTFKNLVHVYNSDADLKNCNVEGLLRMDSTGGTTNLELHNSYVDGSLFMNSNGARIAIADISNTAFNANEDATAANNPDSKKYRFVAFNDVVYDLLNL